MLRADADLYVAALEIDAAAHSKEQEILGK